MKKRFSVSFLLIAFSVSMIFAQNYGKAKNVIMMIPDGMSIESQTMARWMEDDYEFVMDGMVTGLVRTNNSNTPIADSAPAATAMATGVKTQSPYIATYSEVSGNMPGALPFDSAKANMPLATILEGAKKIGKSTGIVSTSNVQHATPADFSSHYPNRNAYEVLAEQQVYQNMNVVFGAGSRYLQNRKDGEDLVKVLKAEGYEYITTTAELKKAKGDKVWGMFAEKAMAYDIDRDPAKEPSLAEMTEKALSLLSKNKKGFFLMVEGSEIDWANHANDPVGCVSDIRAFDKAVAVAKKFADKNPGTVIVIAADHGTGGLTFGENGIAKGYDKVPLDEFTRYIKNAKKTCAGAAAMLDKNMTNIVSVMSEVYGINDLTNDEISYIKNGEMLPEGMQEAIGHVIAKRSHIGYTTTGHVGGDIALYCYTSGKVKPLIGSVHNADIGKYMASVFGLDLNTITDELYNEATNAAKKRGATAQIDTSDTENLVLVMSKKNTTVKFPANKNRVFVNGKELKLQSLVVYNGEKFYVPQEGLNLVK